MTGRPPVSYRRRKARLATTAMALLALGTGLARAEDAPAIPPIPAIVVPDFMGIEPAQQNFEDALGDQLAGIEGLRVAPARCDAAGALLPSLGMVLQDDAGITANLGDKGQYLIDADGTGVVNLGTARFIVEDDGSGVINREGDVEEQITVEADGSGTYNSPDQQITLDGQGGGTWNSDARGQITIEADGSGTWNGPLGQIINEGDGSGSWNGSRSIINDGNGRGTVDGQEVDMEPLPPVPPAGKFPLLTKFRIPPAPCGYVITLDDSILFDFDQSDLRADATATVDALAEAFTKVSPARLEIRGHTDSKGSDDYNQDLSERRARTVASALSEREVTSDMAAQGFGESQPVAANEIDGTDNPAGRQLNRRVEIFVPNR
ncbi:OmpA family protein [Paracoccus sulfuroxidans]|uniref:OOP family OmpA-OmpF porin n=1 Tax=Paracoccus sulfuroxidans TaxID=384678 RepID=A0A562NH18_9RHOB|nr:OmpA family protein [Paracoccus sulfuroxidans]TWI31499.1 OOP family OmpA-OmpF porin [Paracoccus sulfuroxidans]